MACRKVQSSAQGGFQKHAGRCKDNTGACPVQSFAHLKFLPFQSMYAVFFFFVGHLHRMTNFFKYQNKIWKLVKILYTL
ncbi:hypothetical protein YC2023_061284 [Brassica napus]